MARPDDEASGPTLWPIKYLHVLRLPTYIYGGRYCTDERPSPFARHPDHESVKTEVTSQLVAAFPLTNALGAFAATLDSQGSVTYLTAQCR